MPQAICTRYGLRMGAKAAPVVRVLLVVFFPVAYPISKVRVSPCSISARISEGSPGIITSGLCKRVEYTTLTNCFFN